MDIWTKGAAALVLVAGASSGAEAQVAGGHYISLDGTIEHQFQPSGDYVGKVHGEEELTGVGVYRQGVGICWMTRSDGSKLEGDVLFYLDEVQCCLATEPISDKVAMTQVWVKGTGFGYRVCKDQVYRRAP